MSLSALKFVEADYTGLGVTSMADQVSGTPATNKAKFDELVKDVVAVRVNSIIDALEAETDGASGADLIAATPITGVGTAATDTVQEILEALYALIAALDPNGDATMPTGAILGFGMTTAPTGWLVCDGSAVSRNTYSALFAAVGETWGAGDDSTTFNLPDLRGIFLRGYNDESTGADANRVFGTQQTDQNKSHTHTVTDSYVTTDYATYDSGGSNAFNKPTVATTTRTTSGNGGTEARPINQAVQYCIKT